MISAGTDGVYLELQVQPKARQPGVRGVHGERLKLAVSAPADGGRANEATIVAIADLLRVPRSAVSIVSGKTSRHKRLFARGLDLEEARSRVEAALDATL